jgi:hypothetical protein
MVVRAAEPGDAAWLCEQLRAFATEYPTRRSIWPSDDYAEALVGTLIRTQFVAIAEEDGQPIGLIAGICQPHALNPDLTIATELAWWVVPPKRGTRAGLLLLDTFDTWATSAGAHLVNMTLEVGSPVSDRCLTRRGYALAERQYLRDVPEVAS